MIVCVRPLSLLTPADHPDSALLNTPGLFRKPVVPLFGRGGTFGETIATVIRSRYMRWDAATAPLLGVPRLQRVGRS
jgi:hypothetical protein